MVDAVTDAIGDRTLGEERSPAPADVFEDRRRPHNVQERVLLASEGRGGQVLCRRARPNRVGNVLVEPRHLADDRRGQIVRHRDRFDGLAELRGARADPVSVVGVQLRQSIERFIDRKRARHDPPERIRRDAEAARHPDPLDPRQLPEARALAADKRDLRLVDLLESQDVVAPEHLRSLTQFATPIFKVLGLDQGFCSTTLLLWQAPRATHIENGRV